MNTHSLLMRIAALAGVTTLLAAGAVSGATRSTAALARRAAAPARTAPDASRVTSALPMAFEPNVGQTDARVSFLAHGRNYGVYVTPDHVTLDLGTGRRREAIRMSFAGAREDARVAAEGRLPGVSNYLVGEDASKWRRDVPTYESVRYAGLYDGVDARLYGSQRSLEYDLEVAPGADPGRIRVRFEGQTAVTANEDGSLELKLADGSVRQTKAVVYQGGGAAKRPVAAKYVVRGASEVGFDVGEYDRTKPLVVDPALVYADFLGGGMSEDSATSVALDASGNAYVVGTTTAGDFPTTPGAYDRTLNDGPYFGTPGDVFVTEINAAGTAAVFSSYLGGSSVDKANDVAVDASGAVYVVGATSSSDFPRVNQIDNDASNQEGFVTKLLAGGGSLVYSTFLGGTNVDTVESVAVDSLGRATVSGETASYNFPVTLGSFDATFNGSGNDFDAFVTRFSPDGASFAFSTFVGGYGYDLGTAVAVGADGATYLAGRTRSTPDFPVTAGAYDTTAGGGFDAYVAKLAPSGASLVYATYLGGVGDDGAASIAVDASGAAYVGGFTYSDDFPVTPGAYATPDDDYPSQCFVTKIAPSGATLAYSTDFGGSTSDEVHGLAVDASGSAYAVGLTYSDDFPTTAGAYDTEVGNTIDAFAIELNAAGTAPVFSTYLGGQGYDSANAVAVSSAQAVFVVGDTSSVDFPTTAGALDGRYAGGTDAFVTKLAPGGATLAYSTYLSGDAAPGQDVADAAEAVAVDAAGNAYVTGSTASPNYPTTVGAYDVSFNDGLVDYYNFRDAFVTKVSADGSGLVYSTFLGSDNNDVGLAIVVGPAGNAYVGGGTSSESFPTTAGALDTTYASGYSGGSSYGEGFVAELAANGAGLVYSTYLGGDQTDEVDQLALGASGTVYATGRTYSPDFPTTAGAADTVYGGYNLSDAFAVQIAAGGGSLVYGTYVGGSADDFGEGIAVDGSGAAYVVGTTGSPNFPTTAGAYDVTFGGYANSAPDGFLTKIAPGGASLAYSTYFGGAQYDAAAAVAVDASGAAYVTGATASQDLPTTPDAYDPVFQFGYPTTAYVTKFAASGSSLVYSTFLGGSGGDRASAIALDPSGAAIVAGTTMSSDFPTTPNAFDSTLNSTPSAYATDGFVTELDAAGASLLYSTYLGGNASETIASLAYSGAGRVTVVGTTNSGDFATSGFGGRDAANGFVAKLDFAGAPGGDSAGIYVPSSGAWFLRNDNSAGAANASFGYGAAGAGLVPLTGDWNGDGVDTPGVYQAATGTFFLKNSNGAGGADVVFTFGAGGAGIVPIAGDWDGDGADSVGLYVTATGAFFLTNANASGPADTVFQFGAGGAVPLAGDWNSDNVDSVGLYDPATGTFFLKDYNYEGPADHTFTFGGVGLVPVTGDWNNDGVDTVGVYVPSTGVWFLRNALAAGPADASFAYGPPNVTPLAGNWDGQ